MKQTQRLGIDQLDQAARILADGGLVAFPTETVFGIGASATKGASVAEIFRAKGRPSDNPLIVHVAHRDQLSAICSEVSSLAERLLARFSPGPLTLVLPKRDSISNLVTAGLSTVAVRIPRHPTALRLLELAGIPIAAPSANRSGKPSGTTWQSVLEDLDGRIDAIICDDTAGQIGLESTVLDITHVPPRILRMGAITLNDLRAFDPEVDWQTLDASTDLERNDLNSPGLRHPHYKPRATVKLCDDPEQLPAKTGQAYIGLDVWKDAPAGSVVQICSDVRTYAAMFYEFLRQADRAGVEVVWCQRVPRVELGCALMDRIERAAA